MLPSQDRVLLQDILHRLEVLEYRTKTYGDANAASGLKGRLVPGRECWKEESQTPSPQCDDNQEQVSDTTKTVEERDSILMEKEMQISRLQEQVRKLTLERDEPRTLGNREKEDSTLVRTEGPCKDEESAMKQEIADLRGTVGTLERKLQASDEIHCLWTESEQKLAKTREEWMRYKAALNTCRKRIKSLEGTSVGPLVEEPLSVKSLVATAKELCASLKEAQISKDVSRQRQKVMYFSLKDFLCQALTAVEERLKDI